MHAAAAAHFELPLPIFEARLLHRDSVLAIADLNLGRRIADEAAVHFDIGTRRIGL